MINNKSDNNTFRGILEHADFAKARDEFFSPDRVFFTVRSLDSERCITFGHESFEDARNAKIDKPFYAVEAYHHNVRLSDYFAGGAHFDALSESVDGLVRTVCALQKAIDDIIENDTSGIVGEDGNDELEAVKYKDGMIEDLRDCIRDAVDQWQIGHNLKIKHKCVGDAIRTSLVE